MGGAANQHILKENYIY